MTKRNTDDDFKKAVYFENRDKWREWLEINYGKKTGIWLIIYKKNSETTGIKYDEAVEEAICFGWIDSKMKSIDQEKYILKFTPRKNNSIWAENNKVRVDRMIKVGKMTEAGLNKVKEARRSGMWKANYSSKGNLELPSDLREALIKNQQAWVNFNNFTASYRTMYVYWINSAKREGARGKRIIEVVKRSAENRKLGIDAQ
jgi:uncharacterized protein YdeI (YjbR/CyaY-like superfamily)